MVEITIFVSVGKQKIQLQDYYMLIGAYYTESILKTKTKPQKISIDKDHWKKIK